MNLYNVESFQFNSETDSRIGSDSTNGTNSCGGMILVLEPIPIVEPLPVIIDMIPQVPILIPSYPHLSTRHAQLRVRIGL